MLGWLGGCVVAQSSMGAARLVGLCVRGGGEGGMFELQGDYAIG